MKNYTDIIIAPVITEKSAQAAKNNVYTFKVAKSSNKIEIKKAIAAAFGVKVESVKTLITKPKDKKVGKHTGKTKTYKKAIVTLKDGESIDL